MRKLFIALLMTIVAGSASAEINCLIEKGQESIEVRVIDTFIDRTAFIVRTHPSVRFPTVGISVLAYEKNKSVTFVNSDEEFHLSVNKLYSERRLPPLYKAQLNYGEVSTEMDCTIE
ncbi:MAG TPA: hypothetical protein VNJ08_07810 [Bacteriovoracaceae bacterium]|nr:hypothetical protein [Bacteriovoracaceae bacterium]